MKIEELEIKGCFKIISNIINDNRGFFIKIMQEHLFNRFNFTINEIFYSRSNKNVIRGMHFQKTPFEVAKIVVAINGSITDVLLDIRKESQTFGQSINIDISDKNFTFLFIPEGIAHGFKVKSETADVLYLQSKEFNLEADSCIHFDSFGFDWGIKKPIISEKDKKAPSFQTYFRTIKS